MPLASAARGVPEPDGIDFTVSSSLPPMVTGGLAGEVELSVPFLYPKPGVVSPLARYLQDRQQRDPMFLVRMQWWGDGGPGTVFKPGILRGRDRDGERARRARPSKSTCALFPVRCGLDGLVTYLNDVGSITLNVFVREGEGQGGKHVGRCVIPVGGWGGLLDAPPDASQSGVVAEGYFPVLWLDGNRYAGDLRVCLRACLGRSSKLRKALAVAKMAAATGGEAGSIGRHTREISEALGGGTTPLSGDEQHGDGGVVARGDDGGGIPEAGRRSGPGIRRAGHQLFAGLPARESFDNTDLADGSSAGGGFPLAPGGVAGVLGPPAVARLPRCSAPPSSFQLNEALSKFDASNTLPVWPSPKGSLFRPPETHGEAPPTPHVGREQAAGRLAAGTEAGVGGGKSSSAFDNKAGGSLSRGSPTCVGVALTGATGGTSPRVTGGPPPKRSWGQSGPRGLGSSVSPERQAPVPSVPGEGGGEARAEAAMSPPRGAPVTAVASAYGRASEGGSDLAKLLNRGKDLSDKMKMTLSAGNDKSNDMGSNGCQVPALPPASQGASSLPIGAAAAIDGFVGLTAQPGLVSEARLGSSLREDIDSIFDTLSDRDLGPDAVDEAGVLVRDPETRGNEARVIDLLLEAAGPPPSALAFPALAVVERRRADSLARVRFLRIRLSRLVMFGSMTSATEGHGWQLRFRLPAFAAPPGRSSSAGGGGRRATAAQAASGGVGRNTHHDRVVSVPVPPRVLAPSLGKSKAAMRRGRPASVAARNATSVLRVRRGFGACDLVVGETSILEEVVCAVDMSDACVSQWMDTAMEFLLVDGKTDRAPRPRSATIVTNHPHLRMRQQQQQQQQQKKESSTVGPGDRVAAVAHLPLRDLLLSADLGVATTLDLVEVSDFWATEDARAAIAGRTGRAGRPLRNPYRSDAAGGGGARPLVLGERAVGALAVALELVPVEQDLSPEHCRPEVVRRSQGSRQQSAATATTRAAAVELKEAAATAVAAGQAGTEAVASRRQGDSATDDGDEGALRMKVGPPPPPSPPSCAAGVGSDSDRGGGDHPAGGFAEASEARQRAGPDLEPQGERRDERKESTSYEDNERGVNHSAPSTTLLPPSLEGSFKESSGVGSAVGPPDSDCAVMLRIDELTLDPKFVPGVYQVRVAYSFSQMERHTPTVTHRSVRGHRPPPPLLGGGDRAGQQQQQPPRLQQCFSPFTFDHQEVFPAPADSSTWRLEGSTSRVFEVWGCHAEGPEEGSGNPAPVESLLGLCKVSLRPFSAFGGVGEGAGPGPGPGVGQVAGGGGGIGDAGGPSLVVGADGPVSVIDPFSGRSVGDLRLFLALGTSPTIAALAGPRGGVSVAGAVESGEGCSEKDGTENGGDGGREKKHQPERKEEGWGADWAQRQEEAAGGQNGAGASMIDRDEALGLDDSVEELSMLLNPGRAAGSEAGETARHSSSVFTGLVRHVIELSVVGELPLALDAGIFGGEDGAAHVDEPVGCSIEYMLPSGQASFGFDLEADGDSSGEMKTMPTGGWQRHELWWDADSGILNSRARHTIKVPSNMLDRLPASEADAGSDSNGGDGGGPATSVDRSLDSLLDCVLGREDVVLSLFWSGGGAGAPQFAPWSRGGEGPREAGEVAGSADRERERHPLGKAVLRRADLLPLVRRTSARVVLRLPIEPPAGTDGGGKAPALLPAPEALPLSICYRREPSAVARRKSRGRNGRRSEVGQAAAADGGSASGGWEGDSGREPREDLKASGNGVDSPASRVDVVSDPVDVDLNQADVEEGVINQVSQAGGGSKEHEERRNSLPVAKPAMDSGEDGGSCGGGFPNSWETDGGASINWSMSSPRTERMLPARTTLCVRVDSVSFEREVTERSSSADAAANAVAEKDDLLWVSFDFPEGTQRSVQVERTKGGVFVWKPGGGEAKRRKTHWSPTAAITRQEGGEGGRVVPVNWSVELSVTIDAAFVEYVHTQSIDLRVWRGDRADWPAGGTAFGEARVVLRSLLTAVGGIGGDVTITPETGDGSSDSGDGLVAGSVFAHLFFKHRVLGASRDDAAGLREEDGDGEGQPWVGASASPEDSKPAENVFAVRRCEARGGARRRKPMTYREEVEVLGDSGRGQASPNGRIGGGDPAARRGEHDDDGDEDDEDDEDDDAGIREPGGLREENKRSALKASGCADESEGEGEGGGELRVYVERAMRLAVGSASTSGDREKEVAGRVSFASPGALPLPSTYVTIRWEEEGSPPLRSPLRLLRPAPRPSSESAAGVVTHGDDRDWLQMEGTLTSDGEVMTPIVENSSNPIFEHAARLRLADPRAWARVCGPSAALVFRVWRRARRSWWDADNVTFAADAAGNAAAEAAENAASADAVPAEQQRPNLSSAFGGRGEGERRTMAGAGTRFGDKVIGSAVVGLHVLRGVVDVREGSGGSGSYLREIDGWYHVLDDLQRPQGQLKVRVTPHPGSRASDHATSVPVGADLGHTQLLPQATLGHSPATQSTDTSAGYSNNTDSAADTLPPLLPPLHDTRAHLRSVHALLDSLPAEFRSTQPRRQPQSSPSATSPGIRTETDTVLELPLPSDEPPGSGSGSETGPDGVATFPCPRGGALNAPLKRSQGRNDGGRELPSLPELRRMLSSLDRVDRRLFALGGGLDGGDDGDSSGDCAGGADAAAREPGRPEPGAGDPGPGSVAASVDPGAAQGGADQHLAISRLQLIWRARSRRRRAAAEAHVEREACALRRRRREEAASAIQAAHRRAQTRYRAAAAAEERRRWEGRQQRREAACAVIERAWRAFEARRRARRELAEARGRATAAVAAAAAAAAATRRAEDTVQAAVLVQAVWRGMSARAATARRIEACRARSRAAAAALPSGRELLSQTPSSGLGDRNASGSLSLAPRVMSSTFYNQLSQDPRRRQQLPEAHLAVAAALAPSGGSRPPSTRSLAASYHSATTVGGDRKSGQLRAESQQSKIPEIPPRFGLRPLARSAGAARRPRFADQETERISRIMKGNLQHLASARSSSSSDDVDL